MSIKRLRTPSPSPPPPSKLLHTFKIDHSKDRNKPQFIKISSCNGEIFISQEFTNELLEKILKFPLFITNHEDHKLYEIHLTIMNYMPGGNEIDNHISMAFRGKDGKESRITYKYNLHQQNYYKYYITGPLEITFNNLSNPDNFLVHENIVKIIKFILNHPQIYEHLYQCPPYKKIKVAEGKKTRKKKSKRKKKNKTKRKKKNKTNRTKRKNNKSNRVKKLTRKSK